MIYTLFLLSFITYLFLSAFTTHIRYFHDSGKVSWWKDFSFSIKKLGIFVWSRPNWVLFNEKYRRAQVVADSLLYLLGPLAVTSAFYSGVQWHFNTLDNIALQELKVQEMHDTITAIKARIDRVLFLQFWLIPLGIAAAVLSACLPFVKAWMLNKRIGWVQNTAVRLYYFLTVFSLFTFFGANEVARQNDEIAGLAVRISIINEKNETLHRKAKEIADKQRILQIANSPELLALNEEINALDSRLTPKTVAHDDEERLDAAEAFNQVIRHLLKNRSWAGTTRLDFDLPENYSPNTPPPTPESPSGHNPETSAGRTNKTQAAGKNGEVVLTTSGLPDEQNTQPYPSEKSNINKSPEYTGARSGEEPITGEVVRDERLHTAQKHVEYVLPQNDSPTASLNEKQADEALGILAELEKQLEAETAKVPPALLEASQKIGNAIANGFFEAIKNAVGADPILSVIADAFYAKAIVPEINGLIQTLLEKSLPKARDYLNASQTAGHNTVAAKMKESDTVKAMRAEMQRIKTELDNAHTTYTQTMENIEQRERAEAAKVAEGQRRQRINQVRNRFDNSKWEKIRNLFIEAFQDGRFTPDLYYIKPEKKVRTEKAIAKWLSYRERVFASQAEVIAEYANIEDVFWNYAMREPDIMPVHQLALFYSDITDNPFDVAAFEEYARSNGYYGDFVNNFRTFAKHLNHQICPRTD